MKHIKVMALVAAAGFCLSACSSVTGAWGARSAVSYKKANGDHSGTLFVWENDMNAAVLTEFGAVCMQRAMAANAESIAVNGDLSDAILSLSGPIASGGAGSAEASESLASVSTTLGQSITALSTSSERTAFLDIGMFYICQLGANKSVTADQALKMTEALITAAAGMSGPGGGSTANVQSQQVVRDANGVSLRANPAEQ
jgi:hypothetical protein